MPRKTIVFGNGIGMALSIDSFSLDVALTSVWEDGNLLTDDERALIRHCLPDDREEDWPSSEVDLDMLQRVLSACDFLAEIDDIDGLHWLSERGREFPPAIRRFVHQVACRFHNTELHLPETFANPLCRFIERTKSHVATLNYDPLLYEKFIDEGILDGYNGILIDGITGNGFQPDNLYRNQQENLGWYLHLHGSPLFYDGPDGRVRKFPRPRLREQIVASTHLVLTHVIHKPSIIAASDLLSEYWKYFERALTESQELVVIGSQD